MNHDKIAKLRSELLQLPTEPIGNHLTEQDFISYIQEEMTHEEEERIDTHLTSCESCDYYVDTYFQEEGEQLSALAGQIRANLVKAGLPLPPAGAIATPSTAPTGIGIKEWLRTFLQQFTAPVLKEAFAATPTQDYASDDGRFGVFIASVDDEVIISVDARTIELAGVRLQFSAESWQSEAVFERVSNDQVLARTVIPAEVYKAWPNHKEVQLYIRLSDARAHPDQPVERRYPLERSGGRCQD